MTHRFPSGSVPPPFDVLIEEREGYLYVCYAGRFDAAAAREAAQRSSAVIRSPHARRDLISDFRNVEFLEPEVADVMVEALQRNEPYVRRSALIGIHGAKRLIMELATERSGRREVCIVRSLEEALTFLREGTVPQAAGASPSSPRPRGKSRHRNGAVDDEDDDDEA